MTREELVSGQEPRRARRLRGSEEAMTKRHADPVTTPVRTAVRRRSGEMCEICRKVKASHLHHRQLRRHGNHTVENLIHCCAKCHGEIHSNVEVALMLGWLVPSWADPATVAWMPL